MEDKRTKALKALEKVMEEHKGYLLRS